MLAPPLYPNLCASFAYWPALDRLGFVHQWQTHLWFPDHFGPSVAKSVSPASLEVHKHKALVKPGTLNRSPESETYINILSKNGKSFFIIFGGIIENDYEINTLLMIQNKTIHISLTCPFGAALLAPAAASFAAPYYRGSLNIVFFQIF